MRLLLLPAVLLALLALGACSGGEAAVPDGFVTLERPVFSLAHPQGWERVLDTDDAVQVRGPAGEGDIQPAATIRVDREFSGDFDHAVDGVDELGALTARPDRDLIRDEPIDVDGAEQARLLEATWDAADDGVPMRAYDVFALTPDGLLVYLSVVSAESDFDESTSRSIVDSLSVR